MRKVESDATTFEPSGEEAAAIRAAVVRRLIDEGFSRGRLEVVDEVVAEEIKEYQIRGRDHPSGRAGVRAVIGALRAGFSDFCLTIEDLAVAGDLVWTRNVATGTNDGSFQGRPPTGRPIRIAVFDVMRVIDGRIVEHWGLPEQLSLLSQLGRSVGR